MILLARAMRSRSSAGKIGAGAGDRESVECPAALATADDEGEDEDDESGYGGYGGVEVPFGIDEVIGAASGYDGAGLAAYGFEYAWWDM